MKRAEEPILFSMRQEWEHLAWIDQDDYLALADDSIDRHACEELISSLRRGDRVIDGTGATPSFIGVFTESVDPVPVEVQRDANRMAVAARLCITYDVDDLDGTEGSWRRVGSLSIPSGTCLAWGPYRDIDRGGFSFPVRPGRYTAESFHTLGDCLGIRLRLYLGESPAGTGDGG
jgi:hypothetical protein